MKKIYLLLLLSIVFSNTHSQTYAWAKNEGLWAYDYGLGVTTDPTGNVYVAGKYELSAVFSGNTITCAGNHDCYLAKYTPSGSLSWIRTAGGANGDYYNSIASDATYIYAGGEIEGGGTITFPGSTVTLQGQGDNDIVLAKYDQNGNLIWARSAGWKYNESVHGIAVDAAGNVYVGGRFSDTLIIGSQTLYGYTQKDFFVAKYDANGTFQWARQGGGPGRDDVKGLVCDAAGNVYITGVYENGMKLGATTYSTTNGVYYDAFLAKYDASGNLQWVQTEGGDYDDAAWAITIDNAGMIYTTGEFNASAYFGATQLITSGNADIFVTCYNSSGSLQWVKKAGGPLIDRARGIGTDGTNLYVTGQFGSTCNFGSMSTTAVDSSDVFFASMSNAGNWTGAASIGGAADPSEPLGFEAGCAITAKDANNIYATGALLNGGTAGSIALSPYDRTDAFVAKLSSLVAGTQELTADPKDFYVYPNPGNGNVVIYADRAYPEVDITVYNCLGQVITKRSGRSLSKVNIDLSDEQNGVYFIEIRSEHKTITTKKLVIQN
jgi:hypothetical protein